MSAKKEQSRKTAPEILLCYCLISRNLAIICYAHNLTDKLEFAYLNASPSRYALPTLSPSERYILFIQSKTSG